MKILLTIKNKMKELLNKKMALRDKLYLEKGSGIVCEDKEDLTNKVVEIIPSHINRDLDVPRIFPEFSVVKTTSKDGQIGMHKKVALILDTDDEPTEGSRKLLTSGLLYEIITDIYNKIDELKNNN
ncbi:hypothetical protein [Lachnospira sp.]|jgi:hypothetical protein|uniref:hypothetical protein n=1 Tax=Lachnospira sp. TaxID=2049031 RepID=UPI00257F249C|nr:hypothetical protein [Lachnospira sp.]